MSNWTTGEIRLLREIFPTASISDLELALPRHSIIAIRARASSLGLHRAKRVFRRPVLHPLVLELGRAREAMGISRSEWARRARINRSNICRLERSGKIPRMGTFIRLAKALNMQVTLKPVCGAGLAQGGEGSEANRGTV